MKYGRQKLLAAAGCLLCTAVALKYHIAVDGSEFSGGSITGPLLTLNDVGMDLSVLALILVFLHTRAAAIVALLAAVLCLPLYFYFDFPKLFRQMFPGEYKVPIEAVHWGSWAVAGFLVTALMPYLCYRTLLPKSSHP